MSRHREFHDHYPAYIVDEFLVLLRNIFEGQAGSHIDEAMREPTPTRPPGDERVEDRLLKIITDVKILPQSL